MKKFLIVLIIVFICGVLSADVCLKQVEDSAVVVGRDVYEQYATAKLTFKHVFWNILYERIKLFGVLLLLCFTPIKEKIGMIFAPIFSFIWGFFLMSSIVELGFAGLIVGLASVIPHGILYAGSIGLLIGGKRRGYYQKNKLAFDIGKYLFALLLCITACVIESLIATPMQRCLAM